MYKIAIIGLGPRGLSVFDRIIAYARNDASATPLELYLFDSKEFGPGCHTTDQADHLLVNTVACQMTQFSDDTVRGAGPLLYGPSFADWLSSNRDASGARAEIDRNGYYSRALFGDYLRWGFEYLKKLAPPHMTIFLHNYAGVDDLVWQDERWHVSYDGCEYLADFVFLTTGHARKVLTDAERALTNKVDAARARNGRLQLVLEPYPIRNAVSSVTAGDAIAIEGMGLTSFDLIAQLTQGRGGTFEPCGKMEPAGRLRYRPSGSEPKILLYSRSGLPLTARAVNQKGVFGQYKPKFLTFAKLESLRREAGGGQLDFQKQIIPLLWCDMQFAYYFSYLHHQRDKIAALMFSNEFMACDSAARAPGADRPPRQPQGPAVVGQAGRPGAAAGAEEPAPVRRLAARPHVARRRACDEGQPGQPGEIGLRCAARRARRGARRDRLRRPVRAFAPLGAGRIPAHHEPAGGRPAEGAHRPVAGADGRRHGARRFRPRRQLHARRGRRQLRRARPLAGRGGDARTCWCAGAPRCPGRWKTSRR